ncbi:MAG: SH3 domain-containing protein [Caldilineaceae bacterium]|nr:SH3 domain-containing protein [Caldilineaceae bacterium]
MINHMINHLPKFVARYWIAVAVFTFALLSAYTNSPLYGQSPTPTPDVNTVPRPEQFATPTNTPFPTPTPLSDAVNPGGGNSGGGNSSGGSSGGSDTENGDRSDNSDNNDSQAAPPAPPANNGGSDSGNAGGGGAISGVETPGTTTGSTSETLLPTDAPTGIVNAVTLNVRRGPSLDAGIIDTIFLDEAVALLGRDSGGAWWYVCCGSGFGREGWVSAQFITLDVAGTDQQLPVTANSSADSTAESAAETENEALILEMRPSPAFVWQGRTVQLQFVVRNRSDQPYTNVRLRNDLPPELLYIDGVVNNSGELATLGQLKDGLIYTINWPEVPAGGQVAATVTLQIANDLRNGTLIDNLAVVDTAEGVGALAGITFAMPPVPLPQFRP